MKDKKEINVYWWPAHKEWNILYNDPINLQESMYKMKNKNKNNDKRSMFECPALSDKTKKTFFFTSPMSVEYEYNFTDPENSYIVPKNSLMPYLETKILRPPTMAKRPLFLLSLFYCFFSEESLTASFTPPFLHNSNFAKQGVPPTGSYDIGQWLRTYPLEIMLWNETGTFKLEKDEPLFYVEFLTDSPIKLQRVESTEKLSGYVSQCTSAPSMIETRVPLITRYETFKKTRMKDLIMKEIKENIL
jgi:hypothetical protein